MVPQKKGQAEGGSKRDSVMAYSKKDGSGRAQNGNRGGFRTDTAISNSRAGQERELTPWVPDSLDASGGLDAPSANTGNTGGGEAWDQFAENERLFGLKTDYDENMYTTTIDKSHPQYKERVVNAEKKAREIERTLPATSHVAEERVMDFTGGKDEGEDEEDKYSGVRRQDFPALVSNREARYTPPAKRAPSGQATVAGAPVDPAIISSQIKGAQGRKPTTAQVASKPASTPETPGPSGTDEPKKQPEPPVEKEGAKHQPEKGTKQEGKSSTTPALPGNIPPFVPKSTGDAKAAVDKPTIPGASSSRAFSPLAKVPNSISATATVERDLLHSFKTFAEQQREVQRVSAKQKAKADKELKLTELKRFANEFKLSTPVPKDLISIIAKDPAKQQEIEARAIKNAKDIARTKAVDDATRDKTAATPTTTTGGDAKPAENGTASATAASDPKPAAPRPSASHTGPAANMANRHSSARQSYNYHQQYRNDRSNQHMAPQTAQRNLGSRLRHNEAQKMAQAPQHPHGMPEIRAPTGPAAAMDPSFNNRRLSSVSSGKQLNPHSHEFRPFAAPFNPNGGHMSAMPGPHVHLGNGPDSVASVAASTATPPGPLIRRKTNAVEPKAFCILSHIKTIQPPQSRRHWDENGGLRPAYDTPPTWRQQPDETDKAESTMNLTYKEYFERDPFSAASVATPNPTPSIPHHHHPQMSFHLQQPNAHMMATRQSPHLQPMQMHAPQPPHMSHGPFNGDDHRMMPSNSSQSFASPRMSGAFPSGMPSPAQGPYNTPVPFVSPQQMNGGGQFRNFPGGGPQFSNHPSPMMMQPQFMHGGQQMVGGPPMYPGMSGFPGGGPPQPVPVPNGGYPSPGRPAPPMMAHQGSQQGQPMYGMSPNIPYQQPAFPPQPGGQMNNGRGGFGSQNFGGNPQQQPQQQGQQMHQYGPPHRGGYGGGGKNFSGHGPQGGSHQQPHSVPSGPQMRTAPETHDDAK